MKTDVWGRKFIIFFFISHWHGFMKFFQKSVHILLYFIDFQVTWSLLFLVISFLPHDLTRNYAFLTHRIVHYSLCLCAQLFNALFLLLRMSRKFTVLAQ